MPGTMTVNAVHAPVPHAMILATVMMVETAPRDLGDVAAVVEQVASHAMGATRQVASHAVGASLL